MPAVPDLTLKIAIPSAPVVPLTVAAMSVAPRLEEIVTVFPERAAPDSSFTVTVMVDSLTYRTWYLDWSNVKTVSDAQLRGISLGKNVVVRAGTVLVKIQTDPKVYAVEPNGLLRWVPTEARAKALYGNDWAKRVVDVPIIFWGDYNFGPDIITDSYPTGALIKYATLPEVYYVQGAEKRMVAAEAAFTANNFRWINVLPASDMIYFPNGVAITMKEPSLASIY